MYMNIHDLYKSENNFNNYDYNYNYNYGKQ